MEITLLLIAAVLGGIYMRRYYITEKGIYLEQTLFPKLGKKLRKRSFHLFKGHGTITDHATEEQQHEPVNKPLPLVTPQTTEAKVLYSKAMRYYERGEIEEAEKRLIQVTALDEHFLDAPARLGIIYLKQGQYGKAEVIFKHLIHQDDTDPSFYSNLGRVLYEQKKFDEALQAYLKALDIDSTRAGRFLSTAEVYRRLNNNQKALDMYKKAVELDGTNIDYLLTFADFLIEERQLNQARLYIEKVLHLRPHNELAMKMMQEVSDTAT